MLVSYLRMLMTHILKISPRLSMRPSESLVYFQDIVLIKESLVKLLFMILGFTG